MKQMTKQQEFDLLFKYPELEFTIENLYDEEKWRNIGCNTYSRIKKIKGGVEISELDYSDKYAFVEEFKDYINWNRSFINLSEESDEFFIKYKDYIKWIYVRIDTSVSDEFLDKFKDKIVFKHLPAHHLTEEQIEKYKNRLTWSNICCKGDLSEDFIRKYKNKIAWKTLSKYRTVNFSVEFMKEFDDKIYWKEYIKNRKTLFS